MKSRAALIVGVLVVAGLAATTQLSSQEPTPARAQAGIMRLKLQPAKDILEGIATSDFQAVRKNTEQLRLLTLDEKWMVLQSDSYRQHTKDFERSLGLLNRMCDEKDIDGVTLAYMQVTMRCVECHRTLRDAQHP